MKMPFSIPGIRGVRAESFSAQSSGPSAVAPHQVAEDRWAAEAHAAPGHSTGESYLTRVREFARLGKKGLSDSARNKLLSIGQQAINARGVADGARNDISQLRDDLAKVELDISIQEGDRANRRDNSPEPVILRKAREDAALLKAEIARLQSKASEFTDLSTNSAALSAALSKYVVRIKDGARSHTIAVEPDLRAGETQTDAVERLRRRIRELRSDLDQVRFAPYPSSEAKQLIRSEIDELAERGAPNLFDVIDHRDRINWPTETTRLTSMPLGAGDSQLIITTVPDTLAVLAWLHRDALIARLEGEIDRCSQDDKALSAEQRAKKSAEILSDILAAEREEETLIERMEAGGALFLRRTDADPRAVLGLSSDMPAPDVAR